MAPFTDEFYRVFMPPPSLPTAYKAIATRTFDDVTGQLISIQWDIATGVIGTLLLTLFLPGQAPRDLSSSQSGSFTIPKNTTVNLVHSNIAGWVWPGSPSFTIGWVDG